LAFEVSGFIVVTFAQVDLNYNKAAIKGQLIVIGSSQLGSASFDNRLSLSCSSSRN